MTIHLVRHGQSEGNLAGVFSGVMDHPLTPQGEEEAIAAAKTFAGLRFESVFVSGLIRAQRTAELLLAHGDCAAGPTRILETLNERNFGILEGVAETACTDQQAADELQWRTKTQPHFRPPGGESLEDTQNRVVRTWLADIVPAAMRGDVLVVSHGNVIKSVIGWYLSWPLETIFLLPITNCLITRLDIPPQGWLPEIQIAGSQETRSHAHPS